MGKIQQLIFTDTDSLTAVVNKAIADFLVIQKAITTPAIYENLTYEFYRHITRTPRDRDGIRIRQGIVDFANIHTGRIDWVITVGIMLPVRLDEYGLYNAILSDFMTLLAARVAQWGNGCVTGVRDPLTSLQVSIGIDRDESVYTPVDQQILDDDAECPSVLPVDPATIITAPEYWAIAFLQFNLKVQDSALLEC